MIRPWWKYWFIVLYVLAGMNNAFFLGRVDKLTCSGGNSPAIYIVIATIWPIQAVLRTGLYIFDIQPKGWGSKDNCNLSVGTVDGK